MDYKSLWIFLRFYIKPKYSCIAQNILFSKPLITGNMREKSAYVLGIYV